eukprot:TRINITY_DN47598_c0_g1_i1.p1 TRINITY_DN47598_c0_g1~~TRINITY_DN47598_c0_g1_i1.p1  ORF type:complete len:720 (+),score=233.30 TRINITY_DN47598_c0_g1_i1:76-2160(+)
MPASAPAVAAAVRAPARVAEFIVSSVQSRERPTLFKPSFHPPAPAGSSLPSARPAQQPTVLFCRSDLDAAASVATPEIVDGARRLLYKCTSESYYALRIPLLRAGFKRVARDSVQHCNIVWRRPFSLSERGREEEEGESEDDPAAPLGELRPVHPQQRVNHFPGSYAHLGSKDGMWSALQRMRARFGDAFEVTPQTWVLPADHESLLAAAERRQNALPLIIKPSRGSCGRDIFVCQDASDARLLRLLSFANTPPPPQLAAGGRLRPRRWVAQEYIDPPLLIEGRKFDLRLYVAVTSFDPLVVYVHREGLVRFASEDYAPPGEDTSRFASLTNSSVARKRDAQLRKTPAGEGDAAAPRAPPEGGPMVEPAAAPPQLCGPLEEWQVRSRDLGTDADDDSSWPRFKWSLSELRRWVELHHGSDRWEEMWSAVCEVVTRTMVAAEGPVSAHLASRPEGAVYRTRSFEQFGFDIMFSADLRPWLIEVNCLPSLESSSAMDYAVKCGAVTDLLNMLQMEPFTRDPAEMGKRAVVDEARLQRRQVEAELEQQRKALEQLQQQSAEAADAGGQRAAPGAAAAPATAAAEPVAEAGELRGRIEALRVRLAAAKGAEDAALAVLREFLRGRCSAPHAAAPSPAEDCAASRAARVAAEGRFCGGYERVFPTAAAVARNGRFFEGSTSEQRNRSLWEALGCSAASA